ncbi:MAG TPA: M48 family metallopeptidase, partial [Polyangiaceae bacterium]|nr:M48 family metallopeptidase [Polyangiaceae bacterium]
GRPLPTLLARTTMAQAPRLDFEAFVARKRAEHDTASSARTAGHEYTYSFDRQSRIAFENTKPVALAVEASVRLFKQIGKHQLLGQAVKVSDRQFPRIHGLTKRACDVLGIAKPQVFVVNDPRFNAATYGTNDDSFVLVHSALVEQYSDEELLTVIGHECGHIHNSHVAYLTALHYLTFMAGMFVPWILQPALVALRTWSRRAEVTCDRAGMLVSKDATAAERAIAKLAVGSRRLYEEFNLDAFLEQHEEGTQGIGRYMEVFATHPWLPKRVLAMRVFGESQLYADAVGRAGGGLPMAEVDTRVATLLKGDAG